ncbi:MAG: alcohol dehydrogenase catalytic domain-containing protein [Candidatus Firestonebacteria bacterium]
MKVGMYYNNQDVRIEELPVPEIGPKDILVKIMASGICGSDIMEWYRIKKAPLVLGHEIAGKVVKTGSDVKKFKAGDRVFSTHHVPCGECIYCENGNETACETFHTANNFFPGGFAEYVRISGKSLDTGSFILADNLSYEQGSFIEPLGTVVRGLRGLKIRPKDCVLILGSGIVGLLFVKLAKALGASRIIATDLSAARLAAAKKFGADFTFKASGDIPAAVKKINNGRLADKVIICAGALPAVTQGLQAVDRGGTVLLFAVPKPGETVQMDFNPYWRNDINIITSYGAAPADNKQAMEYLSSGKVYADDLITHRFTLDEIGQGFKIASAGGNCLKVIIKPNKDE